MAQAQAGIVAEDLRAFRRALRQIDPELTKELRRAYKHRVAEPVAQRIKTNVPRGPGRGGRHWYQEVRSGSTTTGAYVQWGRTLEYPPWVEFGGEIRQPNRGVVIKRTRTPGGRYVYPVVNRARVQVYEATQQVLEAVHRRAGLPLE